MSDKYSYRFPQPKEEVRREMESQERLRAKNWGGRREEHLEDTEGLSGDEQIERQAAERVIDGKEKARERFDLGPEEWPEQFYDDESS